MLKMFQLLWVFFVQLLAQTVEIYPSENFRYIAVVNGTKSYGIIFGAADPDLDTTGKDGSSSRLHRTRQILALSS